MPNSVIAISCPNSCCSKPCSGCGPLKDFGFPSSCVASIQLASTYDYTCSNDACGEPMCSGGATMSIGDSCNAGAWIELANGAAAFQVGIGVGKSDSGACYVGLSAGGSSYLCPGAGYGADGIVINGLGSFTLSGRWVINTYCADCEFPYYYVPMSINITLY